MTSGNGSFGRRLRVSRHLLQAGMRHLASRDAGPHLRKALALLLSPAPELMRNAAGGSPMMVLRPPPAPLAGKRACLFVTYSPDGRFWPHTLSYCRDLKEAGHTLVLIVTTDRPDLISLDPGPEVADALVVRENSGFDFAAWSNALRLWPELWSASRLLFANDSVYHAPERLKALLERIAASPADAVALTVSPLIRPHFQSYFFAFGPGALACPAARDFFEGVSPLSDKDEVIRAYETRLKGTLEAGGLHVEVLFKGAPWSENPTLVEWRELVAAGFPFVKVQLLRDNPYAANVSGWRQILGEAGFPVDEIAFHLGWRPVPPAPLLAG